MLENDHKDHKSLVRKSSHSFIVKAPIPSITGRVTGRENLTWSCGCFTFPAGKINKGSLLKHCWSGDDSFQNSSVIPQCWLSGSNSRLEEDIEEEKRSEDYININKRR